MRVDFSKALKGIKGECIPLEAHNPNGPKARLGDVAVEALMTDHQQRDQGAQGKHKIHRWNIAKKIHKALGADGMVELIAEDVALIKDRLAMWYGPGVIGPAYEAIETVQVALVSPIKA